MSSLPAGWYKDPADTTTQRYWDGEGWIGKAIPADAVPPDSPPPVEEEPPPATPAPPPPGGGGPAPRPPRRIGRAAGRDSVVDATAAAAGAARLGPDAPA